MGFLSPKKKKRGQYLQRMEAARVKQQILAEEEEYKASIVNLGWFQGSPQKFIEDITTLLSTALLQKKINLLILILL